ncbi:rRNA small subunit methyltransferase, glucose inhibited division protein GidB [Lachnospiraceae bacterium TWA4]|nr:rRNA small subunit methyltransferase, glucose inhibited division protein GidB [Lachnospiraceae bacterium TWA4]
MKEKLISLFSEQGFSVSDHQAEQFLQYYKKMVEVNQVMNLTAITDYNEVLIKHYLDSVMAVKYVDWNDHAKVIDMGTGAGFPGIPLKILYPEIDIVLVDSLNKRVKFLNEVIKELGLKKAVALHARAEELGRNKEYRGQFDYCVSRAVASLPALLEFCTPFLKVNGEFIAYKSLKAEEEIASSKRALNLLKCQVKERHQFSLGESTRDLIVIQKMDQTPKAYPRKAGTPAKNPL